MARTKSAKLTAGVDDNSGYDSDIQEITVVATTTPDSGTTLTSQPTSSSPPPQKRRKSSPLLDPMPTYTPTPLYILEQRARATGSLASYSHSDPTYSHAPLSSEVALLQETSTSRHQDSSNHNSHCSRGANDEYVPLLEPSPNVVGRTTVTSPEPSRDSSSRGRNVAKGRRTSAHQQPANSSSALRPVVSSTLTQAVARRRSLQSNNAPTQDDHQPTIVSHKSSLKAVSALLETTGAESSKDYAEKPVMWSPHLPSQIETISLPSITSINQDKNKAAEDDEYGKYTSPRVIRKRVAHQPLTSSKSSPATDRQRRPAVPLGVAKKVPSALRVKYLDIIVNEYVSTGLSEDDANKEALNEEQSIAHRAANKSIYINLVAGLKKRIREKAGISKLPQDESPKYVNGNKVVSHSEILTGRVTGTFSIERKRKISDPSELDEHDLYTRLLRYVMPIEEIEKYGYPVRDTDDPTLRKVGLEKNGQKQQLKAQLGPTYNCERCNKVYRVDDDGMPSATTGKCIYHPGRLWNQRISRSLEKRYSCCKGDPSAGGCSSNPYHVHRGELELKNYVGYVETRAKPEKDPNRHGIFALDCEMCYTTYGLELTRVTVINYKFKVVYEKLVKPDNPILDYNTKFSGIKEEDLSNVKTTLVDVQNDLLNMFSSNSLLIGHSLDSDMKALKIFHKKFVDTAQLFPHKRGLPFKRALRTLMIECLQVIIQEDVGHDSKEDAMAAFRLVMWKAKTDVPEKSAKN